jgi:tRNA pseudouridine38-40 synthase
VAHLKVPELRANITPTQIQHGFNDLLPHDINILKVSNAPDSFHARHDALARYYIYRISTRRNAFAKSLVWWIKDRLDVKAMKEAAALLVGKHDFVSFCELEEGKKQSTVVKVDHAEIFIDGDQICFRIGASHFLWKMVRRMVGVMVDVGTGGTTISQAETCLLEESPLPAKLTAPASGLFLERVYYRGDARPPLRGCVDVRFPR